MPVGSALVLWISNQSYRDDPIHLTITLDDEETVVSRHFHVGRQHTYVAVELDATPGPHVVRVETDTSTTAEHALDLPADRSTRWLAVSYFHDGGEDGRLIDFHLSDRPFPVK